MAKLERLKNNPKFNIIADDIQFNAIGGKVYLTKKSANAEYSDCWDDSTGKDVSTTVVASGASDAYDGCSTSASVTSSFSV